MPTEWYYARDGEQFGPLGFDELKQRASTGLLRDDDLVWSEAEPNWMPAFQIAGLFPRIATEWYYSQGDERFGPVSDVELERLAVAGRLQPSDLVWSESEPDWKPASRVSSLFDQTQPGGGWSRQQDIIGRVEGDAAPEEMGARSERTTQVVSGSGVGGGLTGELGSAAQVSHVVADLAGFINPPARLLGLLLQAPIVAVAIRATFGADRLAKPEGSSGMASILFWLGLAALWFGLSDAVIVDILDAARTQSWHRHVAPLLRRLGAMGGLLVSQCAVAWVIVSNLTDLGAAGLAPLALLILTSAVGLALGCLVVSIAPRLPSAWAASGLMMVLLWLFGGGPQSLPRESSWTRVISNAVPSRWAFEGLLLLRADRPASPEAAGHPHQHGGRDIAGAYFPLDSERMGARADVMALVSMLIGLSAASAFFTWASEKGRGSRPDP